MGGHLSQPSTDKDAHEGKWGADGLPCGHATMQGFRREQEDAHIMLPNPEGHPDCAAFAVFDGHCGSWAACESAAGLMAHLNAQPGFSLSEAHTDAGVAALRTGFISFDARLRTDPAVCESGDSSGSTVVLVLLTPTHYVIANAGDSRAVLVRGDGSVWETADHKPTNPEEAARVCAAGGHLAMGRVNGDLAVSRGFGDFRHKRWDVAPEAQPVSCEPTITVLPRKADDAMWLLACDGVWDVFSSAEFAAAARQLLVGGMESYCELACALADVALERGSYDNITVIAVGLPGRVVPTPDAVAAHAASREEVVKTVVKALPPLGADSIAARPTVNPPACVMRNRDAGQLLYIGCVQNAEDESLLSSLEVTALLNVAAECEAAQDPETIKYRHVPLAPSSDLLAALPDCSAFIDACFTDRVPVMVYCSDGRSRSVAVVVGVMMQQRRWGMHRCYETVKAQHPFMWPGPSADLVEQLSKHEAAIFPEALAADTLPATIDMLKTVVGTTPSLMLLSQLRMRYIDTGADGVAAAITPPADERIECPHCHRKFAPTVLSRHTAMHKTQMRRMEKKKRGLLLAAKLDAEAGFVREPDSDDEDGSGDSGGGAGGGSGEGSDSSGGGGSGGSGGHAPALLSRS